MVKNSKRKNPWHQKRRKEHPQRHPQALRNWPHSYQWNPQLLLSPSFHLSFPDWPTHHLNQIPRAQRDHGNPQKTLLQHLLQHQRLHKSENQFNEIEQLPELRREVRRGR